VQVKVLDIDRDRQRISLGLKQTQEDPWQRIVDTYNLGDELEGKVTKVVTFGAFVEVLDGVEGLVHISELAGHHVESPREIVHPGDEIRVKILEIDSERRRLSLSAKRVEDQILPVSRPEQPDAAAEVETEQPQAAEQPEAVGAADEPAAEATAEQPQATEQSEAVEAPAEQPEAVAEQPAEESPPEPMSEPEPAAEAPAATEPESPAENPSPEDESPAEIPTAEDESSAGAADEPVAEDAPAQQEPSAEAAETEAEIETEAQAQSELQTGEAQELLADLRSVAGEPAHD